jgi:hypothetical protein
MNLRRKALLAVATSMASIAVAVAQAPPPPDTSPAAASSPHQRQTTRTQAPEAPPPNGAEPTAASSPHQQETTSGSTSGHTGKAGQKQAMKDCMTREQADHTGMSAADAKKSCKQQLKTNSQK